MNNKSFYGSYMTVADLEKLKQTLIEPKSFGNAYNFILMDLENDYLSKSDGLDRIKSKLQNWDTEARLKVLGEVIDHLKQSGVRDDDFPNNIHNLFSYGSMECHDENEDGDFKNGRGAVIHKDVNKHKILYIPEVTEKNIVDGKAYHVLSVGIYNGWVLLTITEDGKPVAYRLPKDNMLLDWTKQMMESAKSGINMLPGEVMFGKLPNRYYVDIL